MRLRSLVELRYQAFTITLATVSITFKNATERIGFEISGVAARDYRIFLFFILCFLHEVSLIITLLSRSAVLFFVSLFHMRIFFCYSISSSRCVIVIVKFRKFIRSIVVCSV